MEIAVINNKFAIETSDASGNIISKTSDITCQANKWYYFRIVRTSDTEIAYYYADATEASENPNYIEICTTTQAKTVSGKFAFGVDASTGQSGEGARQWYWTGKIDFDNSYMRVNDTKIDFLVKRDTYNVYLETNGGTIYEKDPTHEDDFLMSLADWGLSEERPGDLPEPSLSVNLMSSNYILNDGYVDDSGTYISVDTVAKITENLDRLSTVNFPWMIWGYDLDIPEYVKYRNGDDFVYVRSV